MGMARHIGSIAIIAWLLVGGMSQALAQVVAFVTDLQGRATISRAGGQAPVAILAEIPAGARIQLEPGARLNALYATSGVQYSAQGPGTVVFESTHPAALDTAVIERRPAAASQPVRLKATGLAQGGMVMRGMGLRPLGPSGTILQVTPVFAWGDSRQSSRYRFTLVDSTTTVVHREETAERTLRLPAGVTLKPGTSYRWEVSALSGEALVQTVQTLFRVASEALAAQAESLRPPTNRASFADRVAYAMWLEQEDLGAEARRWWRELAAERPDQTTLKTKAGP